MKITAVCIGNEILRGRTLNTNLSYLGKELYKAGFLLTSEICVPDETDAVGNVLQQALRETDLVFTVGGLGPTSDDLTRAIVADLLKKPLILDLSVSAEIESYMRQRNITLPAAAIERQSLVPTNAEIIKNRNGTAPGLICVHNGSHLIMLPGPPREFIPMVRDQVVPWLLARFEPEFAATELRICGLPESVVAERVEKVLCNWQALVIAYCATTGGVDVHLRICRNTDAAPQLAEMRRCLQAEFGAAVLPECASDLPAAVGLLLRQKKWSVATAESCTGGGIAEAITDIPGATDYFHGAVVTYANSWKQQYLGVAEKTLAEDGAVSAETAREMVTGLLERYAVDAGIAVTGIAGPHGGSLTKPVGLVFIATAVPGKIEINRYVFPGSRETVRQRTVTAALNQLRLHLLAAL